MLLFLLNILNSFINCHLGVLSVAAPNDARPRTTLGFGGTIVK
ncbi:hypothetical protein O3G_MSEX012155 [Manduca sexta]|uniref:Uncharacterized protein n=1 Tax=Manduca sexta TaxID=7130 RepID=A0A921ZNX7_MANSE|nr:hypothetical protein O3G_MSEX012155 [Manduca sexta]